MSNQKYDAIWVKGSFFEKGHWKLVPRADGGGALVTLIAIGIAIFIVFCLILTLPLWISLLGFFWMVKSKRYYAGIGSILALIYFFIDIYKNWISGYLLFGYNSSDGTFNEGLLGEKFAIYFYIINGIGALIALIFIAESELFSETEYSINKNHTQSNIKKLVITGLILIVICLGFYSILTKNHKGINVENQRRAKIDTLGTSIKEVNNENNGGEIEFVPYPNDTLPKAKLNVEKVYFYFEPNNKNRTSYFFTRESKDMIVNYSERKNGFIYVYNDSEKHNGWMWMLESDFELIDDVTYNENSNEIQAINNEDNLNKIISIPNIIEGYSFDDYSCAKLDTIQKAIINFSDSPDADKFKDDYTRNEITNYYNTAEINFGGHYILTGEFHNNIVIVDSRDGKIYKLFNERQNSPDMIMTGACENHYNEFDTKYNGKRIIYKPNSTLIIRRGMKGLRKDVLTYGIYNFDETKKKLIKIKYFEKPFLSKCE